MIILKTLSPFEIQPFVERYEEARQLTGSARIRDFLPATSNAQYFSILIELIRVDLEYEWEEGKRPRLENYLREFPELRGKPEFLNPIVEEESRQCELHGESTRSEEYCKQYQIDRTCWSDEENHIDSNPAATNRWPSHVLRKVAQLRNEFEEQNIDTLGQATRVVDLGANPVGHLIQDLRASHPAMADRLNDALTRFPQVGTEFLGFRLLRELGRGSFARVFLAEQANLAGRLVALKVTTNLTGEPQTLAQLQHTNIVPIYSVHTQGSLQAVCMPYFGSTTLADVVDDLNSAVELPQTGKQLVSTVNLRRQATQTQPQTVTDTQHDEKQQPITRIVDHHQSGCLRRFEEMTHVDTMLWITARLAEGLAHAHEHGILHRDLKPANVLITDDGQPMLLDFNLSENSQLPKRESVGGTLAYMAPEHLQAFTGKSCIVDERADIYAIGLMLYEMLTGRQLFPPVSLSRNRQFAEMIHQRQSPNKALNELKERIAPGVVSILSKCLAAKPGDRYQQAKEIRDDIERHLGHLPLKYAKNSSVAERASKWVRRHPRLSSSGVVATVLLAVLLVVAVVATSWRENLRAFTARHTLQEMQADLAQARVTLYRREPTKAEWEAGLARAQACIDRYEILSQPDWATQSRVRYLSKPDQQQLREDLSETLYLMARGTLDQAQRVSGERRTTLLSTARHLNEESTRLGEQLTRATAVQKAEIEELEGKPEQAATLRQAVEAVPSLSPRDLYLLGHDYAKRGQYERAIPSLIEATQRDPRSFPAWFVRGLCHYSRMQFDRASECFSVCIALQPNEATAWQNRGLCAFRRLRHREALADFNRAVELLPEQSDLRLDRAVILSSLGRHQDAIEDLDSAIALGTTRTRVYFLRAIVRQRQGDAQGARKDRELARSLTPSDEGSWLAKAEDRARHDREGALRDVEEALKINPISSAGLQIQAHLLTELGQIPAAERTLNRAVELYPDHAPFWCGRAVHYARLGKREEAIRDAREAVSRDSSASNLYQAGCVYALTSASHPDDRYEAFRLLRAALVSGFGRDLLQRDNDLDPIRHLPEFLALEKYAQAQIVKQQTR